MRAETKKKFCLLRIAPHTTVTLADTNGPRYDDYTSVAYFYLDHPAKLPCALPSDTELVMK